MNAASRAWLLDLAFLALVPESEALTRERLIVFLLDLARLPRLLEMTIFRSCPSQSGGTPNSRKARQFGATTASALDR